MHFSACIARLREKGLLVSSAGPSAISIDRLTTDSRDVRPSDCFFALRGVNTDGHLFIDKAVQNGASAIVSELGSDYAISENVITGGMITGHAAGPAFAHVSDSHKALAEIASLLHGDPGQTMSLIATTGTNGKTTVATLIAYVLNSTGKETGFIGTTGYRYLQNQVDASHTTPSAVRLYELLGEMQQVGCTACSMEASSHAIDQARFRPADISTAVFTNLSRDHLDYHHTYEAYGASKKRLFDELSPSASAITNADDAMGHYMVSASPASVTSYGMGSDANIRYTVRSNELSGLVLDLDGVTTRFRLAGRFNASNVAAAYTACLAEGLMADEIRSALATCPPVRGRMETFQTDAGTTVIVDYAHTPDALENVLSTVRSSLPAGSDLWCLFGCGGDRDKGKRPEMGAIAERLADNVVVTSDNPRTEAPLAILEDIRTGFEHPKSAIWLADRREAIQVASERMKPGDTLVLAGKGHETYQVNGTERIHFDDLEEAKKAFEGRGQTFLTNYLTNQAG